MSKNPGIIIGTTAIGLAIGMIFGHELFGACVGFVVGLLLLLWRD